MIGIMKTDIHLVSTSLKLQAGQRVKLWAACNLPQAGYFARPADGKWSDGMNHSNDDSILLNDDDFTIEG